MDYDTRKQLIFNFMTATPDGVLTRYERPAHLSDDSARGEINDMVEDLNSKIPDVEKDKFFAILERFRVNLRQLGTSRRWPTIPQLLRSVKAAVEDSPVSVEKEAPLNYVEICAERIKAGDTVDEYYVFGAGADILLERGLVTIEEIKEYKPIGSF